MIGMVTLLYEMKTKLYWKHAVKGSHFSDLLEKNNTLILEKQRVLVPWIEYAED